MMSNVVQWCPVSSNEFQWCIASQIIVGHCWSSLVITCHHISSQFITCHHMISHVITAFHGHFFDFPMFCFALLVIVCACPPHPYWMYGTTRKHIQWHNAIWILYTGKAGNHKGNALLPTHSIARVSHGFAWFRNVAHRTQQQQTRVLVPSLEKYGDKTSSNILEKHPDHFRSNFWQFH